MLGAVRVEGPGEIPFVVGEQRSNGATSDALVAALAAMGVKPEERPSSRVVGEGIRGDGRITYFFKPVSDCGNYGTAELIKVWNDDAWHRENPLESWAYVRQAMRLATVGNRPVTWNDLLIAALQAMGIQLSPKKPKTAATAISAGDGKRLYAAGKTACGKYTAAQLLKWWEDDHWHERNPEHVFAFVKCALINLLTIQRRNTQQQILGKVYHGKRCAIVSLNASKGFQDRVMRRLERRRG